jgi:SAM domain (Sterile alpha motif)
MDDIAAWLEQIGLGQYAELFRANDITETVLPELTDEDLKDLGLSLGHRRLMLKAIKTFADTPDEVLRQVRRHRSAKQRPRFGPQPSGGS